MFFRFQKNFLNTFKLKIINQKKKYMVYDKNLYISPSMIGLNFKIHMGNIFFILLVKQNMLGYKINDFIFTKKRAIFRSSKKKKKSKSMGHLVNPISFRLGKTFYWNFVWSAFLRKNYKYLILQDLQFIVFFRWILSLNFLYRLGLFFSHFKLFRLRDKLIFIIFFIYKKNYGFSNDIFKFSKKIKGNSFIVKSLLHSKSVLKKRKILLKSWEFFYIKTVFKTLKKKKKIYEYHNVLKKRTFIFFRKLLLLSKKKVFFNRFEFKIVKSFFKKLILFYFYQQEAKALYVKTKNEFKSLNQNFKILKLIRIFFKKYCSNSSLYNLKVKALNNVFFQYFSFLDSLFFLFFYKKQILSIKIKNFLKNFLFLFKSRNIFYKNFYKFFFFFKNKKFLLLVIKFFKNCSKFSKFKTKFLLLKKNLVLNFENKKNNRFFYLGFKKFLHKIYSLLFENRILFLFEFFFIKSYEYIFFFSKHKFMLHSYIINSGKNKQFLLYSNANLISRLLYEALRFKKFNLKKAIFSIVKFLYKMPEVNGYRIAVAGRLTRSRRGLYIVNKEGKVPLSTLRIPIDYSTFLFKSKFGICGIKVWLNKSIFSFSMERNFYLLGMQFFFKQYKKKFAYLYYKNLKIFRYLSNLEKIFKSKYISSKTLSKKFGIFSFVRKRKNVTLLVKSHYHKIF